MSEELFPDGWTKEIAEKDAEIDRLNSLLVDYQEHTKKIAGELVERDEHPDRPTYDELRAEALVWRAAAERAQAELAAIKKTESKNCVRGAEMSSWSEEAKGMAKGFGLAFAILSCAAGLYIISGGTLKLVGLIIGGLLMFLAALIMLVAVLVVLSAVTGRPHVESDERI